MKHHIELKNTFYVFVGSPKNSLNHVKPSLNILKYVDENATCNV